MSYLTGCVMLFWRHVEMVEKRWCNICSRGSDVKLWNQTYLWFI